MQVLLSPKRQCRLVRMVEIRILILIVRCPMTVVKTFMQWDLMTSLSFLQKAQLFCTNVSLILANYWMIPFWKV